MTDEEFNKLTVGSIVMCNKERIYNKTVPGVRCGVIELRPELPSNLRVQILDGIYKGERYSVHSKYFNVYHPLKQIEEAEVLSLMV